jgi:hypothetical protein
VWPAFFSSSWLQGNDSFSELQTVRIEAVNKRNRSTWYCSESQLFAETGSYVQNTAEWRPLLQFIRNHPSIVDVMLSGLNMDDANLLANDLCFNRRMERVLLGTSLRNSFDEHVAPYPSTWMQPRARKRASAKHDYTLQAWIFYVLLFQGLELGKSGHRPTLKAGFK